MPTTKILAGASRFQARYRESQELVERLATPWLGPKVMFIACSDSRVAPELITSAEIGDLFVTRNVANIVPPYGTGELAVGAVIEHAVLQLGVGHIIVCGHTDCAGIKALDHPSDWRSEPHIARWIEYARPARTKIEASGLPEHERHLATVRENVLLQLEHLRSYDPVREGERTSTLRLHGWVFRVEAGMCEVHQPEAGDWVPLESRG